MKKLFLLLSFCVVVSSLSGGLTAVYYLRHRIASVTVGKLIVEDGQGKTRAVLGVDETSHIALDFFSLEKTRQLSLGVVRNPYKKGNTTFYFGDNSQLSSPLIEFDDTAGRASTIMTTSQHGNSILTFFGPNESYRMGVGYVDDGSDTNAPNGVWGLRAQKGFDVTSIGVLDYNSANGAKYIFPNSNEVEASSRRTRK